MADDEDEFSAKVPERVAWDLLGSSASSLAHEEVTRILERLVDWARRLDTGTEIERAQAERLFDNAYERLCELEGSELGKRPGRRAGAGEHRRDLLRLIVAHGQRMLATKPDAYVAIAADFVNAAEKIDNRFAQLDRAFVVAQLERVLPGPKRVSVARAAGVMSAATRAFGDNEEGVDPSGKKATNVFAKYLDDDMRVRGLDERQDTSAEIDDDGALDW